MASTMFDLPQPLGPTMQVIPVPLNVICVFSQNDLKPNNSTLRSLSTRTLRFGFALFDATSRETKTYVLRQRYSETKSLEGRMVRGPAAWRMRVGGYGRGR